MKSGNSVRVMPRVNDILNSTTDTPRRIIRDYEELEEVANVLRAMGKKIVLTMGVYDLLHVGHARYLREAKALGDILFLSVDTDALTRERKGPTRPIVHEEERFEMLLHLRHVDAVIVRDVEHYGKLKDVEAIRPHVLVTSETTADFTEKVKQQLREKYHMEIVTLIPQAQTSTTARIRTLMIDGAQELAQDVSRATQEFINKLRA